MASPTPTNPDPDSLIAALNEKFPARELQLRQLYALLDPNDNDIPSPPNIILYGLESTGKSLILRNYLAATRLTHAWVDCDECITARHLTERVASSCREAVVESEWGKQETSLGGRCENINALAVYLGGLLRGWAEKFVLVLDRIHRQREAPPTLLAALGRLGEMIKNLTIVYIVSAPTPRYLSTSDTPHIHFPPYTKEESILILSKSPRRIHILPPPRPDDGPRKEEEDSDSEYSDSERTEDLFVWTRFLNTVWETLAKGAARDIVRFRETADKMWEEFVEPIKRGEYGTRNFSSLYVLKRDMFRTEENIVDMVVRGDREEGGGGVGVVNSKSSHDLPYYSKYLLFASYLASYNPPRQDTQFFLKSSDKKRRRRAAGTHAGRQAKNRKIHRRLLGPQPFVLERMLAIFRAILPGPVAGSVDIQTQIATLSNLRLLMKTNSGGDPLESSVKWRVNVGWEYIHMLARSAKFDIENFLAE